MRQATRRDVLKAGAAAAVAGLAGCRGRGTPREAAAIEARAFAPRRLPDGKPLRRPGGIALGRDGQVIVGESGRHRLRLLWPSGSLAGQPGRAGTALGEWNDPAAVISLPSGKLLVADRGNGRLVALGPDGRDPAAIGRLGIEDDEFLGPSGLAVGPRDPETDEPLVLVADSRNRRVKAIRLDGTPRAFLWDGNILPPRIRRPEDVAFLASPPPPEGEEQPPMRGLVVVADALAGSVRAFGLLAADVRVAFGEPADREILPPRPLRGRSASGFGRPLRVAAAGSRVLAADPEGVWVLDSELRTLGRVAPEALGGSGRLKPGGVAWDPSRKAVLVSDSVGGSVLGAEVVLP
ncbi:MAG: NHL repeat-containing protein [Planctomycetales bacterium]|nr:NHL repeat-containing protein [Planctomycetales bacterium]